MLSLSRCRVAAIVSIVPLLAAVAVSGPAEAAPSTLRCQGTFTIDFAPALISDPQTVLVAATSTYDTCDGIAVAGQSTDMWIADGVGCLKAAGGYVRAEETIAWDQSAVSTSASDVQYATIAARTGVAVLAGWVTGGRYSGARVVKVMTSGENPMTCAMGGGSVSAASGVVELEIHRPA